MPECGGARGRPRTTERAMAELTNRAQLLPEPRAARSRGARLRGPASGQGPEHRPVGLPGPLRRVLGGRIQAPARGGRPGHAARPYRLSRFRQDHALLRRDLRDAREARLPPRPLRHVLRPQHGLSARYPRRHTQGHRPHPGDAGGLGGADESGARRPSFRRLHDRHAGGGRERHDGPRRRWHLDRQPQPLLQLPSALYGRRGSPWRRRLSRHWPWSRRRPSRS